MEGIELIKDHKGNITQIRVDVENKPELAEDVYHLISAIQRAKETSVFQQSRKPNGHKPLTQKAFNQLIRKAKASGEVSEAAFFQQHPQWQKSEKLS
jgi:hypothetical protein